MTNNHLAPRTIREWLELIPFDRARKEAIELCNKYYHSDTRKPKTLSSALFELPWDSERLYFREVYYAIRRMEQSVKLKQ